MDNGVLIEEITKEELFERRNKFVEFEVSNINSAVDILNDVGLMQDRDFKFDGWGRIHLYTHLELRGKLNALFVNSGIDVEKVNLCEENLEEFFTRVISNN
jgi:ABC-2 type transport system ATP-binding protein/bacitracin transport system ATP-binding protein